MKHRSSRFSKAAGVSLVEVLAGLVVLGTVLAAVVIARGRALRQWAEAEKKLQAVRAADELVERWVRRGGELAVPSEGVVVGGTGLKWRARYVREDSAARLGAAVVRLEVWEANRGERPLAAVEFLVDAPQARRRGP